MNPGCDLTTAACQDSAYPVIASHAGLRELSPTKERNEGGLTTAMIERIRAIGGTVAVGTSGGESRDATVATAANDPTTGQPWAGIYTQSVANDCAGSSRTFAQGYLYTLRSMRGKGVTLGTDINGFEAQLNPRFGSLGCYARGNVPRILQYAHDGTVLIDNDNVASVNPHVGVPFNYDREKLGSWGRLGTAGGQRLRQRDTSVGLNYQHYAGTPPAGGAGARSKFYGLWDPTDYHKWMHAKTFSQSGLTVLDQSSMIGLSPTAALIGDVTNSRTFDFNYDGLAHYGMLPDMLQDTRAVGMTTDQLAPLFHGAEAVVQAWEKACRLSDPTVSSAGCP